jgi:hypothetical protein
MDKRVRLPFRAERFGSSRLYLSPVRNACGEPEELHDFVDPGSTPGRGGKPR